MLLSFLSDGRPLAPSEPPYQVSETVQSVVLEWGASITPAHAPLLSYSLTYWLQNQSRSQAITIETSDNYTTFELESLMPGSTYNVVVRGRNSFGLGAESAPGMGITMMGVLPPAPTGVNASVQFTAGREAAEVSVSWQVS